MLTSWDTLKRTQKFENIRSFFKFWWLSHNIRTLQANRHRNTYLGIQMNAKEVDSSKKYVKKNQSNAHSSLRRIICLVCIKNGLKFLFRYEWIESGVSTNWQLYIFAKATKCKIWIQVKEFWTTLQGQPLGIDTK